MAQEIRTRAIIAYVRPNFKTKKALKLAVASGERVEVFQPNNLFGVTFDGRGSTAVEGPHYPEPHHWYASVNYENGIIKSVK